MELLSGWLKQIVILVLVATFIDLLLPNNSMERYVKLVMGLLIIMAILSPLFQLVRQDLNLTNLAFEQAGNEESRLASLSAIRQNSEKLKNQRERMVREEAEKRMARMIGSKLEAAFDLEVVQARVKIQKGQTKGSPEIDEVFLTVIPEGEKKDTPAIQPVDEVDPVTIGGSRKQNGQPRDKPSAEEKAWRKKITRFLRNALQLKDEQIKVEILEGDRGR
ncbi:stage III sporulation protein AF [Melghirimyces profundicolus]|uniref:Stage III sporulation protein AF n=1 Tax=Melghirimyces profundicolus TaxID=1242148 RepID=A0A2T6BCX7_9BACL|nr:stage III sporulation protein AF [Melghirimyces profundicolus]PTX53920.1 stage III sporulation protein AF [Melghirimyces profundicolus]